MDTTPEDLQRALGRERQELLALIDPRVSSMGLEAHKPNAALKAGLVGVARAAYTTSADPQAAGCLVLKRYSTDFMEKLALLPIDDRDHVKLTEASLAVERVFVAAFAVQYLG